MFQWEDPEMNRKKQLRWTSMPQGFIDFPKLFGQALEHVLSHFVPTEGTKLPQYVDDLLVAGPREEVVRVSTTELFRGKGVEGVKVEVAIHRAQSQVLETSVNQGEKEIGVREGCRDYCLTTPANKEGSQTTFGIVGILPAVD